MSLAHDKLRWFPKQDAQGQLLACAGKFHNIVGTKIIGFKNDN